MSFSRYGVLVYTDDIVLLALSLSAKCKLLAVCESFVLNVNKSNFLVITPGTRYDSSRQMNDCSFSIGDRPVTRVNSYMHLGHIINCQLDDSDDVRYRHNCFIGQSNNASSYFNKTGLVG
jgi:hypothetical protein